MGVALATATLKALLETEADVDWPPPEHIQQTLLPIKSFNRLLLPEPLRRYVEDVSHRMQCPPDFIAVALVVMLGSLIGSRCCVRPKQRDNWQEYPNLWGAIVARPGSLKSPALAEALSPLRQLERAASLKHDQDLSAHQLELTLRKLELEQLKQQIRKSKSPVTPQDRHQMAGLVREVDPPALRRYRTNDATPEKLAAICAENPRGVLVDRDELVGLLENCSREGREGERAFYLEGWNGSGKFTQDRIGRGHISVERLCLSLLGGIQPLRLKAYMRGSSGLQNDGLLQRFQLLCFPNSPATTQIVDLAPDKAAAAAIDKLVLAIDKADFAKMTGQDNDRCAGVAPYFRFDRKAQDVFNRWLATLDTKVRNEDSPFVAEHLSKYRKLVPALALIFAVVGLLNQGSAEFRCSRIAAPHINRATRWASYLESHMRRVYSMLGDARLDAAIVVQRKIKRREIAAVFSERDVYRKGWAHLDDPDVVRAACRELVDAGWLRRVRTEKGPGRPSSPKYEVNPKVYE